MRYHTYSVKLEGELLIEIPTDDPKGLGLETAKKVAEQAKRSYERNGDKLKAVYTNEQPVTWTTRSAYNYLFYSRVGYFILRRCPWVKVTKVVGEVSLVEKSSGIS